MNPGIDALLPLLLGAASAQATPPTQSASLGEDFRSRLQGRLPDEIMRNPYPDTGLPEPQAQGRQWKLGTPLALYGGSALADLASTEYGLAGGGLEEANPLPGMGSTLGRAGYAGAQLALLLALDKYTHKNMPGLNKWMRILIPATRTMVAANNVRLARKYR